MEPTEYERVTAIVTHATLMISIQRAYPNLTIEDRDAMVIGIIDRLARMRGWAVRREFWEADDGE